MAFFVYSPLVIILNHLYYGMYVRSPLVFVTYSMQTRNDVKIIKKVKGKGYKIYCHVNGGNEFFG